MAIDTEAIAYHVKGILKALGEDPEREGLKETPERVARMYAEVFAGIAYSNHEIAEMFGKTFPKPETDAGQTVVAMKDISVFSYCEHHMALMYDMSISIGYIPKGRVIGLSKIPRIAEMCCKRLQLQEKIGEDIAEVISLATGSDDVIVHITSSHSCMSARGIKSTYSQTTTLTTEGVFNEDHMIHRFMLMKQS